jgi:hypothetical protein
VGQHTMAMMVGDTPIPGVVHPGAGEAGPLARMYRIRCSSHGTCTDFASRAASIDLEELD